MQPSQIQTSLERDGNPDEESNKVVAYNPPPDKYVSLISLGYVKLPEFSTSLIPLV